MTQRRPVRPAPPPPPPQDRSWAARMEGLNRETPAGVAMGCAIYASLSMLIGWTVIIIPSGGNIRGNPLYWLITAPLLVWIWFLQKSSRWAVNSVGVVLLLAPCLSLLAVFVAPISREAAVLDGGALGEGVTRLDTPLAMLIILGVTTALSGAGLMGLLRSSLPGGTRPITCIALGTPRLLVLFPAKDVLSVLILAWFLTEKFWLAAGGAGVLALIGAIVRLFGPSRPIVPAAVRHTGLDRVRAFGFNAVAAWTGLGILTVLVMADTRTGPFAWFARAVLGWEAGMWFAIFGLGLIAIAAPLVLAAIVPRQERWPVVQAIQDAVRPPPRRRNHPK